MKKKIVITGADGTGKSTLTEQLCIKIKHFQEISIWDAMDSNLFHSKKDIDNYLHGLTPNARLLFLAHALTQSLENGIASSSEFLIINGYYYKYFASELALGTNKELVAKLIDFFPKPDLVIRLETNEEITFLRKGKLSRYECGCQTPSEATFVSFQKQANAEWVFFDQTDWKYISADLSQEKVYNDALSIITPLFL